MRRHPFPRSRLFCFATLLVAAAFSGCGDPGRQEAVVEARTVRVAMVERVVEPSVLTVAAVVRPNQRALMGTRQAGTVEAVMVRTGDRVEKNQALLRVDARDLEAVRARRASKGGVTRGMGAGTAHARAFRAAARR